MITKFAFAFLYGLILLTAILYLCMFLYGNIKLWILAVETLAIEGAEVYEHVIHKTREYLLQDDTVKYGNTSKKKIIIYLVFLFPVAITDSIFLLWYNLRKVKK